MAFQYESYEADKFCNKKYNLNNVSLNKQGQANESTGYQNVDTVSNYSLKERYFYRLPMQSNIYSFICLQNENCNFLIPSFKKKLFSLKYDDGCHSIDEVQLPKIPNTGDIISMDSFHDANTDCLVLGLTYNKKDSEEADGMVLNIYCDWSELPVEVDEDDTYIPCYSFNLDFVPYGLKHCVLSSDSKTTVFLLGGSDSKIHIFRPNENNSYDEDVDAQKMFPEFQKLVDVPINFEIRYSKDFKSRTSAVFGDQGNVLLCQVDLSDAQVPEIKNTYNLTFDYATTCGQFFTKSTNIEKPFISIGDKEDQSRGCEDPSSYNVIVATSLEGCYVIRNAFAERPTEELFLTQSDNYDVVTCCLVCDINFDGVNEVLIGTYGQVVLIYKENNNGQYVLGKILEVSEPVLSLAFEDHLGDGFRQLIVHTASGVHVYSHDPSEVSSIVLQRLKNLFNSDANEDSP